MIIQMLDGTTYTGIRILKISGYYLNGYRVNQWGEEENILHVRIEHIWKIDIDKNHVDNTINHIIDLLNKYSPSEEM